MEKGPKPGRGRQSEADGLAVLGGFDVDAVVEVGHVVEGDDAPQIEFFTQRDRLVKASVKAAEVNDPKGLALLTVSGKQAMTPGLSVLALDTDTQLKGGDEVMAIGFPRMGGDWAVSKGHLSARQGRELIFAMPIGEGNSGGPLIKDGKVVALVTSEAQGRAFAAAAASVKLFLEGSGTDLSAQADAQTAGENASAATAAAAAPVPATPRNPTAAPDAAATAPPASPTAANQLPKTPAQSKPAAALPAAARALLEGKTDAARAQVIGQIAAQIPGAQSGQQAAALLHGTTEADRASALYYLAQHKKLETNMPADAALSIPDGTTGAQRTTAIGYVTPFLAGALNGAQLSAMLEPTKETDRFNAVYALGRNKKIKTNLGAAEAVEVLRQCAPSVRIATLGELIPFLAANLDGAQLNALLETTKETDRFNGVYALARNKKIKSGLTAAEAEVLLQHTSPAVRTQMLGELVAFLAGSHGGGDLGKLLGANTQSDRFNAIYALGRNKKIKNELAPAEAQIALKNIAAGQRTAAIGELIPFLVGNLAGKDIHALLQSTKDADRFNAVYALSRNKKIKSGLTAADAELILDDTAAGARASSIGELAAAIQPNLKSAELGKILGTTQDQDRLNALNALIVARKVSVGLTGEELKPLVAGMSEQSRDAALGQLLTVK